MRQVRASLGFAIALAVFLMGPALIPGTFAPYPHLRWGDVLDLATPLVVLPAAWLLLRAADPEPASIGQTLAFVALAALWASAQGMHLAANAIGHELAPGGDGAILTHDLDEVLSHWLWHAALLGLTALIAWRSLRDGPMQTSGDGRVAGTVLAAVLFGFTFFVIVVEGQTALFALPGAALIAAGVLRWARSRIIRHPAAAMFALGYLLALALCLVWAGLHGWQLIEFSKAGLIE